MASTRSTTDTVVRYSVVGAPSMVGVPTRVTPPTDPSTLSRPDGSARADRADVPAEAPPVVGNSTQLRWPVTTDRAGTRT